MIRILFVLLCLGITASAQAKPPAVRGLCTAMVEHQPDADVNYHPGMQVQGAFDVPVNVENSLQPTYDVIKIPVTLDLLQALGVSSATGFELEPDVAMIEIHMDGRVTYNGQDIQSNVSTVCGADALPPSVYDSEMLEGQAE